jgi:hypothetical protein
MVPPLVQEVVDKVEKVSFTWAKLIARIYETNPLLCTCGKEIKILSLRSLKRFCHIPPYSSPFTTTFSDVTQKKILNLF